MISWKYIREKFLSKQFILFIVVGLLNTLINYLVLWGSLKIGIMRVIGVALAFIVASIFSYFANSRISFNNRNYSWKKAFETFTIFLIRLLLVELLTEAFVWIIAKGNLLSMFTKETKDSVANLFASILLIPVFYLVLEKILKEKKEVENDETHLD